MKRAAWLLLVLGWAGCTWLIDPNGEAVRCSTETDATPCAQGYECRDGVCVTACGDEICGNGRDDDCDDKVDEADSSVIDVCGDQLDNDCDGEIDEQQDPTKFEACGNAVDDDCDGEIDEGHDQDDDGHQWCGDTRVPNGAELADCNDYDPTVFKGAPERCDGSDNDCDGEVDEDPSTLCDNGEECVAQRCVRPSCAVEGSSEACGAGEMCDLATGACVPQTCSDLECQAQEPGSFCDRTSGECRSAKRANGDDCAANEDCLSGSCVDAAAMRLVTTASRVCGSSCCSDEQCPAEGERCFASGSGARSCLPVSTVPVPSGASDTCSFDNQCDTGNVCAVRINQDIVGPNVPSRDDLITTVCSLPAAGARSVGQPCDDTSQCGSQACVVSNDLSFYGRCSRVCRTTTDCAPLSGFGVSETGSYCRYLGAATVTTDGDYVSVCVIDRGETGPGAFGDACRSGADCIDAACVGASRTADGYCAPACCHDSQCPALGGTPSHCRPIAFGDHYEMRCVR